jgi:hypothetical protein
VIRSSLPPSKRLNGGQVEGDGGAGPATVSSIFSYALRWQLVRIMRDQSACPEEHTMLASIDAAFAEMWRVLARPDSIWRKTSSA